jgi:hypothetical protein
MAEERRTAAQSPASRAGASLMDVHPWGGGLQLGAHANSDGGLSMRADVKTCANVTAGTSTRMFPVCQSLG